MNNFITVEKKIKFVKNDKKMLCKNILSYGFCSYGYRCKYAHSIDEQQLSPLRKEAYEIINSNNDLTELDLTKRVDLYKMLCLLTKICKGCVNGKCQGGKNCKNGVYKTELCICYNDLVYGNCENKDCLCIHLTKRGLIPFMIRQHNKFKRQEIVDLIKDDYIKGKKLDEDFFDEDIRDVSIFNL